MIFLLSVKFAECAPMPAHESELFGWWAPDLQVGSPVLAAVGPAKHGALGG